VIGLIPCSGNNSAFQGLEFIRSILEHLYHAELASPLGRLLVLQLIGVSLSHYQVGDLELSRFQLGLVLILHPPLQGLGLDAHFLPHFIEQI